VAAAVGAVVESGEVGDGIETWAAVLSLPLESEPQPAIATTSAARASPGISLVRPAGKHEVGNSYRLFANSAARRLIAFLLTRFA